MAQDAESDLFGNPSRPGRGCRGRPPYEPTEKDRNKVKLLLAIGWSNTRIANALDVSAATLKRYFRSDLKVRDQMRDRLEARRFEAVAQAALDEGNMTALRELNRMLEKSDLMEAARRVQARDEDDEKPAKLGKKAVAQLEAQVAGEGSDWGDDLLSPTQRIN